MLLAAEICQNTIRAWKYAGLLVYILKVTVGLAVIITSSITIGTVVTKGTAEAMKAAAISIAKKTAAAIIVFLVPSLIIGAINLLSNTQNTEEFSACEACMKEPNSETCTKYIIAFDESMAEESETFKQSEISGEVDTCDLGLSSSAPLDYSYKGNGKVRSKFSSKTLKIVEKHLNDFDYTNFHSYIKNHGGFKKYTKELGGVFQKGFGKNWKGKTITDLQEASEYVFGYMTMYGFDYFNGRDYPAGSGQKYCKWGGSCLYYSKLDEAIQANKLDEIVDPVGTSDAFYTGSYRYDQHGLSGPLSDFDQIIQGDNMTTNCNWTVDMVYFKAGIFGKKGSSGYKNYSDVLKNGEIITRLCDLRVGDMLHFYKQPVDHTNRDTWHGWGHIAYIGEIDGETGTITVYDGGSYMTNNRNFKWTFNGKGEWPVGLHGYAGWSAVRAIELEP